MYEQHINNVFGKFKERKIRFTGFSDRKQIFYIQEVHFTEVTMLPTLFMNILNQTFV